MSEQHVAARDIGAPLAIDRLLHPVRQAYRWAGVALVTLMVVLPALQVVMRQLFQAPFIGSEELTRFMLICVVFVTLPYVTASGASIRMEELLVALPRRGRSVMTAIINATGTLAFAVAAVAVAVAMLRNLDNATPTLGIPYWIFFSAALLGFAFAAVESLVQIWKALAGHPPYVRFADEETHEPLPNI
jgi:TRAP-type C4-dicarboxylate transport system permease small subunit